MEVAVLLACIACFAMGMYFTTQIEKSIDNNIKNEK